MGLQILPEGLDRFLVSAFRPEQQAPPVQIHEQRHVVLPPPGGGLVHRDGLHRAHVHPLAGLLHVVVHQAPEPRIVLADDPGHRLHGHLPHQRHEQGFEQQREPRSRARPRHFHLLHPVLLAAAAGNPRRQVGRVLEEVQMPPGLFLRVMNLRGLPALRAGEGGSSREVDPDVQPPRLGGEHQLLHLPGGGQSKRHGEEGIRIHPSMIPALPAR
ncbi:hypothetical protein GALL_456950 [mine drainage metagenome]|uniref:Uncharacterized protein n=1 Tax=mine drainage metagenome TaxID=410659 RepID=A0A1J5PMA1_9ZZZZ